MSLLDPLAGVKWWLIGGAGLALVAAIGAQQLRVASARGDAQSCRVDLATEKGARQQDRALSAAAYAAQSESYRAEEQRRTKAQQKVVDEAEKRLVKLRADQAIADAAAGRLRQRVVALVAAVRAAANNPAASASGASAPDAVDLLADLQRRADERAGLLARVADERGAAGEACVAAYESLTAASAAQP